MTRLSDRLARMSAACAGETVTLRAILPTLTPRDHALVALFVAVCSLPPVPMPGVSIGFALVALTAGTRMALGLDPWLPKSLLDRPLPARPPGRVLGWAAAALRRAQPLVRPRLGWASAPWLLRAHGAAIAACGAMLLIPLPPPTNIPPAGAMLLVCLGVLEGDGLLLGAGYLATALSAAFFGAIGLFGVSGLRALLRL